MPVTLLGIGTALPPHRLSQAESAAMAQRLSATTGAQATLLRRLQRRSGVAFRHSAALAAAAVDPAAITHLVTVCCNGFQAPSFDLELIQALPLAADVARTQADTSARVLLCAHELCSLHQQLGWHPERVVANALFADLPTAPPPRCWPPMARPLRGRSRGLGLGCGPGRSPAPGGSWLPVRRCCRIAPMPWPGRLATTASKWAFHHGFRP